MDALRPRLVSGLAIAVLMGTTLGIPALTLAKSPAGGSDVRTIVKGGSINPSTETFTSGPGDVVKDELPDQEDEDSPDPYSGNIIDRSLSRGSTNVAANTTTGKRAKSNPSFVNGFEGLNHYQQRYSNRGNQFSIEPPDQALCVGGGYVVEAVNDVFNVFDKNGHSLLPDNTAANSVGGASRDVHHAVDLNNFYGYPAAINRTTGAYGPELTDPTCIYDASSNRFFLVVLTLDRVGTTSGLSGVNHLDLAVTQTGNPTGAWNVYKIDVTNDGHNNGGGNPGPYLGDYPHIGFDANGVYLTTNAYPWCCNGFGGAQIYALPKAQLAAGAASVTGVHFDTSGMVQAPSDVSPTSQPGFTVWPAQSPNPGGGNTEYFMSSNAADEATHPGAGTGGTYVSNHIVVWSLKGTNTLGTARPSLTLSNGLVSTETYALPPKAQQPGSGTAPGLNAPQGHCLNDTTTATTAGPCWALLVGATGFNEVISRPDSNDTRMQQVMFANGKLWGALDTALNPDGGAQRAGIAWFVINPNSMKVDLQGYLGAAGYDFTYPAIGVTSSGRGVMAFTAMGSSLNPSAAYASIDSIAGVGSWDVVPGGQGAAPDDGFTSYKAQVGDPPRTRWGDYGAASVDGNSVWIASEYIAAACDYTAWGGPFFVGGTGDNLLGTCGGASHGPGSRTALANWSTRISQFKP